VTFDCTHRIGQFKIKKLFDWSTAADFPRYWAIRVDSLYLVVPILTLESHVISGVQNGSKICTSEMASSTVAIATIRAVKGRKILPTRAALTLVSIDYKL